MCSSRGAACWDFGARRGCCGWRPQRGSGTSAGSPPPRCSCWSLPGVLMFSGCFLLVSGHSTGPVTVLLYPPNPTQRSPPSQRCPCLSATLLLRAPLRDPGPAHTNAAMWSGICNRPIRREMGKSGWSHRNTVSPIVVLTAARPLRMYGKTTSAIWTAVGQTGSHGNPPMVSGLKGLRKRGSSYGLWPKGPEEKTLCKCPGHLATEGQKRTGLLVRTKVC